MTRKRVAVLFHSNDDLAKDKVVSTTTGVQYIPRT